LALSLLFLFTMAASLYGMTHRFMPYWSNVVRDLGLMPLSLHDTRILGLPAPITAPGWIWIAVTVAALTGGVLLARAISNTPKDLDPVTSSLYGTFVVYLLATAVVSTLDRFALPLLPAVLAMCAALPGKTARASALAVSLPLFWFAVCGTQDLLAWNRARLVAVNAAQKDGVLPHSLDAGYEWNAWWERPEAWPNETRLGGKSWWWVRDDYERIALNPMPGYRIVSRHPYRSWLDLSRHEVLRLRRE